MSAARSLVRALLFAVVGVAGALALVEATLAAGLAFPFESPLLPAVRELYFHTDRDIIQFNPVAARWDPELFYTLRPGRFTFAQREFRHEFRVNQAGLRDDDAALDAPRVIALGDSFTMGWGVAQEQAYPKIVEAATGLRTLNAGIASYGTVREVLMLNRLDTSRLRYLIIQYSGDDIFENLAYWRLDNHHISRDEAAWLRASRRMAERHAYFPGKYTWDLARRSFRRLVPKPRRAEAASQPATAELFLNVLRHAPRVDLSGVRLIVWEPDAHGMVRTLREHVGPDDPVFVRNMTIVDVATGFDRRRDFWVLDDHLNASGHRLVAERLAAAIREIERR